MSLIEQLTTQLTEKKTVIRTALDEISRYINEHTDVPKEIFDQLVIIDQAVRSL